VCVLKSANYRVSIAAGLTTRVMTPIVAVLDTGAGPNLIRESVLPDGWEKYRVHTSWNRRIVDANGKALKFRGVVELALQLGELVVRTRLAVVSHLSVPCILGCDFIDRHVKAIVPKERRIY
jgi:Retroviral aspartyl protease